MPIDEYDLPIPKGIELYPHQVQGIETLQEQKAWGLFWVMGTGKTLTAILDLWIRRRNGMEMGGLVITTNRNRANWERQVGLYGGGMTAMMAGESDFAEYKGERERLARAPSRGSDRKVYDLVNSQADVNILNAEALVYIGDFLKSRRWPFIIIDESTVIKNHKATRTKTAMALRTDLKRILTGLPDPNGPLDLYSQLEWLEPMIFGGNFYRYQDKYAKILQPSGQRTFRMIIGFKNLKELDRILETRTSKVGDDVLGLKPITWIDHDVPLEGPTLKHYLNLRDELRTWWGNGDELKARLAITQLTRLAQVAGGVLQEGNRVEWIEDNPKVLALDDILAEVLADKTKKAVIFTHYQEEIRQLLKRYKKYQPRAIYGELTTKVTDKAWMEFQEKGDPGQLMIAQPGSGGVGIDLFAAQTCIYYSRSFDYEDYYQSYKRLHRIGQNGTVRVIHLMARLPKTARRSQGVVGDPIGKKKSIDETIANALASKAKTSVMSKKYSLTEVKRMVEETL